MKFYKILLLMVLVFSAIITLFMSCDGEEDFNKLVNKILNEQIGIEAKKYHINPMPLEEFGLADIYYVSKNNLDLPLSIYQGKEYIPADQKDVLFSIVKSVPFTKTYNSDNDFNLNAAISILPQALSDLVTKLDSKSKTKITIELKIDQFILRKLNLGKYAELIESNTISKKIKDTVLRSDNYVVYKEAVWKGLTIKFITKGNKDFLLNIINSKSNETKAGFTINEKNDNTIELNGDPNKEYVVGFVFVRPSEVVPISSQLIKYFEEQEQTTEALINQAAISSEVISETIRKKINIQGSTLSIQEEKTKNLDKAGAKDLKKDSKSPNDYYIDIARDSDTTIRFNLLPYFYELGVNNIEEDSKSITYDILKEAQKNFCKKDKNK